MRTPAEAAIVSMLSWGAFGGVPTPAAVEIPGDDVEGATYQLVLTYRDPQAPSLDEREIVRLQDEHLDWLRELYDTGRAVLSGPVDGADALRGVFVLDAGSVDAARGIIEHEPWVRAGRVRAEVHPWSAAAVIVARPADILRQSTCWIGLLVRPDDAPEYPQDRLREIEAGHAANVADMAASGILVMAGPVDDDGAVRGVMVFRNVDPSRLREAMARDPAVKAGRVGVQLYPWNVPRGVLPAP